MRRRGRLVTVRLALLVEKPLRPRPFRQHLVGVVEITLSSSGIHIHVNVRLQTLRPQRRPSPTLMGAVAMRRRWPDFKRELLSHVGLPGAIGADQQNQCLLRAASRRVLQPRQRFDD